MVHPFGGFLWTLFNSEHPVIARVGNVNVARPRMRNHAVWFAELSLQGWTGHASVALLADPGEGDELALGYNELADEMIACVSDENVVITICPQVFHAF